jgi:hypothetical protein
MKTAATALVSSLFALAAVSAAAIDLQPIGTLKTDPAALITEDPRAAEINAFDAHGKRIYVVNPKTGVVDVIDASLPTSPQAAGQVNLAADCAASLGAGCPTPSRS